MTAVQGVVPEDGADQKMPPGVLVEGPVVDAKFLDSYIAFGFMVGGSIAALIWAFWQGIGWVEISVFVGMFALTTVGIGFMHGYFVHRYRSSKRVRRAPGKAQAVSMEHVRVHAPSIAVGRVNADRRRKRSAGKCDAGCRAAAIIVGSRAHRTGEAAHPGEQFFTKRCR